MKKIILLCAGGMSTSILVMKMKEAAKAEGFKADIDAFAVDTIKTSTADADCVLIGPQVGYRLDELKEQVSCPISVIDMTVYGMMDGASALKQAKALMGF